MFDTKIIKRIIADLHTPEAPKRGQRKAFGELG
jgi:hypothetical protein